MERCKKLSDSHFLIFSKDRYWFWIRILQLKYRLVFSAKVCIETWAGSKSIHFFQNHGYNQLKNWRFQAQKKPIAQNDSRRKDRFQRFWDNLWSGHSFEITCIFWYDKRYTVNIFKTTIHTSVEESFRAFLGPGSLYALIRFLVWFLTGWSAVLCCLHLILGVTDTDDSDETLILRWISTSQTTSECLKRSLFVKMFQTNLSFKLTHGLPWN